MTTCSISSSSSCLVAPIFHHDRRSDVSPLPAIRDALRQLSNDEQRIIFKDIRGVCQRGIFDPSEPFVPLRSKVARNSHLNHQIESINRVICDYMSSGSINEQASQALEVIGYFREILYQEAYQTLKSTLQQLANPILAEAMKKAFGALAQTNRREEIGVELFADIVMPSSLKNLIGNCFEVFPSWLEDEAFFERVRPDLSDLSKIIKGGDGVIWNELRALFSQPEIGSLPNVAIQQILKFVQAEDVKGLRGYLTAQLGEEAIDDLNQRLEDEGFDDLATLSATVISKKPKKQEGLFEYLADNKKPDFFKGKELSFMHPQTGKCVKGLIKSCQISPESAILVLDEGMEVIASRTCSSIKLIHSHQYGLWRALCNEMTSCDSQHPCEIEGPAAIFQHKGKQFPTIRFAIDAINIRVEKVSSILSKVSSVLSGDGDGDLIAISLRLKDRSGRYVLEGKGSVLDAIKQVSVYFKDANGNKSYCGNLSVSDLDRACRVSHKSMEVIARPSHKVGNDPFMKIREESDPNKQRLRDLKEINEKREGFRNALSKSADHLLDRLLENLIQKKLQFVDRSLLPPELRTQLEEIHELYSNKLKSEISIDGLFQELVEESNYHQIVKGEQSLVIAKTMELLKESNDHIKKMQGKKQILFMGNTGAGKSTTVDYLLGAKVGYHTNHVGDQVVELKGDHSNATMATIGQSIGESQTIYTSGYPVTDKGKEGYHLVDCPGFKDTRGGDYEICANLSIDQAVQAGQQIGAVVVVLPVQAFLHDRGNPVIELVDMVRERFPSLVNPNNPEHRRLFFCLTKPNECGPEVLKNLTNGNRIDTFLSEANQRLESESNERLSDPTSVTRRRQETWSLLAQLSSAGNFSLVDIENKALRRELMEKLTDPLAVVNKSQYVPAMQGSYMQQKFGEAIELGAGIWTQLFSKYLDDLPKEIQDAQTKIAESARKISATKESIRKNQDQTEDISKQITDNEAIMARMSKGIELAQQEGQSFDVIESLPKEELKNVDEKATKDALEELQNLQAKAIKDRQDALQELENLQAKATKDHQDALAKLQNIEKTTIEAQEEALKESIKVAEKAIKTSEDASEEFQNIEKKKIQAQQDALEEFQNIEKKKIQAQQKELEEYQNIQNKGIQAQQEALTSLKSAKDNEEKTLSNQQLELHQIEQDIKNLEQEVTDNEKQRQLLSTGSKVELLWEYRPKAEQMMTLKTWKSQEHRIKAHQEMRYGTDEEFNAGSQEVKQGDYTGPLLLEPLIDKDYRLLPADLKMREVFLKSKTAEVANEGKYVAEIKGEHYEFDLDTVAAPCGTQIKYSFRTHWVKERSLPWIEISHTMPNIVFQAPSLTILAGALKSWQETLAKKATDLQQVKAEIFRCSTKLQTINEKIQKQEADLEKVQKSVAVLLEEVKNAHKVDLENARKGWAVRVENANTEGAVRTAQARKAETEAAARTAQEHKAKTAQEHKAKTEAAIRMTQEHTDKTAQEYKDKTEAAVRTAQEHTDKIEAAVRTAQENAAQKILVGIAECNQRLETTRQQLETKTAEEKAEIETTERQQEESRKSIAESEKSKRHCGIILHQQLESAQMLRDLCDFVLSGKAGCSDHISRPTLIAECRKFATKYDDHVNQMREQAKLELGLLEA